jgi:acyl-CoA synthetase (AMP-forming)/AMP-acid ligase II
MQDMSFSDFLVRNSNRYPEKTAIVYRDCRLTYRDLNERINRLAHHLMHIGVQKGDRVGFMFYNSNQFVESFFAVLKTGAMAVPLNWRMVAREIKWVLDQAKCKVFAYDEAFSRQVDPVKKQFTTVESLICSGRHIPEGEYHFEVFTQEGIVDEPKVKVDLKDPAFIMHTGGTTGVPKGALHTHGSTIFSCAHNLIRQHVSGPDEAALMQIPIFHTAGLTLMGMHVFVGGKCVMVETMDPQELLRLIDQERPTYLSLLPPSTYIRLLDVPNLKDFDTTSVTKLASAVAAFPKALMLRVFDTFPNASLLYGYGQTETSSTGCLGWFTRDMVEQDLDRIRSVGREHPFAEIRLVDDEGRDVPLGEEGEAIIKSPTNMIEYFEQTELTAETIRDGWLYSGDMLKKDADGFFYFVGRKKDMIKSGGENVFAQEVESVILSHEAVENCAVIGIPDPQWGEIVMAVTKLRKGYSATEKEIQEHCKAYISSYKKPRKVVFVDEYPVSDAGKVQKFKLREKYSQMES